MYGKPTAHLAARDWTASLKQGPHFLIVKSFAKVLDVHVGKLFGSIAHHVDTLAASHKPTHKPNETGANQIKQSQRLLTFQPSWQTIRNYLQSHTDKHQRWHKNIMSIVSTKNNCKCGISTITVKSTKCSYDTTVSTSITCFGVILLKLNKGFNSLISEQTTGIRQLKFITFNVHFH